jgi:hypothetical protein
MNLSCITAELAYELVHTGAWTVAEFQAWHIFKLQEADNRETDNGTDKYFVEAYEEAFGYFPSLVQGKQVKFFNAVVNLCKNVALDPMTYDETECGDDVARDIGMAIDNLRVKED